MLRKLTFIFVLALLFGAFLVVSPYLEKQEEPPRIEDRLPDADFIATADCIRLAREVSGMMFYYKVTYRDFLTPEFVLAQAKNYGLNLQKQMYVFVNKDGEYGIVAELTDSTKLGSGIEKLDHFFDVQEIQVDQQKVYKIKDFNVYLFYGKDFICIYKGEHLKKRVNRIVSAKTNQVTPTWMELINQQRYLNKSVVLYSHLTDFDQLNVNQAIAYPVIDSTKIVFHAYLATKDTVPFKMKEGGETFIAGDYTKTFVNLHLDPSYLQAHPEHPINKYLAKQSARIRFPYKEFIKRWNGDIVFQQGGWINVQENYIESELDDDFNVTEVKKSRIVKASGFSVHYSLNQKYPEFVDLLQKNGFLTVQDDKFHLLLSPPLTFKENKDFSHTFYPTLKAPKMVPSTNSFVMWMHKGTQYKVMVDSINTFELYGNLSFSMEQILKKKKLADNF